MALRTALSRPTHQDVLKNRCDFQTLKAGIKKQFRDHQRDSREKLINQRRNIEESGATEDIRLRLKEIRANLSKGFDSDHEDYLNVIFKEVEWELYQEELQRQAEEYEQDLNKEVDLLTRNVDYCIVCHAGEVKVKDNKFICENCTKKIFESRVFCC